MDSLFVVFGVDVFVGEFFMALISIENLSTIKSKWLKRFILACI